MWCGAKIVYESSRYTASTVSYIFNTFKVPAMELSKIAKNLVKCVKTGEVSDLHVYIQTSTCSMQISNVGSDSEIGFLKRERERS